jgi:hypothetical protein
MDITGDPIALATQTLRQFLGIAETTPAGVVPDGKHTIWIRLCRACTSELGYPDHIVYKVADVNDGQLVQGIDQTAMGLDQ